MSLTPLSAKPATAKGPVTGASILAIRDNKAVIVKRGKEPSKGLWALPGGKQEPGETLEMAARRELTEETSLVAGALELLEIIEPMRHDPQGNLISHYVLGVFITREVSGTLIAGDDAAEAAWVSRSELERYQLTDTTLEILLEQLED